MNRNARHTASVSHDAAATGRRGSGGPGPVVMEGLEGRRLLSAATYLSDLTPAAATNGAGPYERDMSNGGNAAGDGKTLNIAGTKYDKGLGVHANSTLTYKLGGRYDQFKASVGVDREVGKRGSVVFQVYLDGRMVYDSGNMVGRQAAKKLTLDTSGKKKLKLVVTDAGDGNRLDHADWANARLTAAPIKPDATNTGPTNPGALRPSGDITVTEDGAVVSDVDVTGTITIAADNVTLKNFRVTADHTDSTYAINVASGHEGILIEDGEVIGGAGAGVGGDTGGFTLDRVNIHGSGADGVKANGAVTVRNSWIHDINLNPGAHADCVQVAYADDIIISNNTFANSGTSNIYMSSWAGSISNVTIDGNWLDGGSYVIYSLADAYGAPTEVHVRNNHFGREVRYRLLKTNCDGMDWSGNRWADTGAEAKPNAAARGRTHRPPK